MKVIISVLIALGVVGGAGLWLSVKEPRPEVTFRTVEVERGRLTATISATGTLEPEEVVDVGAQVAGQIRNFGHDLRDPSKPIDYGSPVEEGTILAQLDDALYAAEVESAKADLGQAEANCRRAEADLIQMRANLVKAEREWARAQRLGRTGGVISGLDYDTAQAAWETARSMLGVGEAALNQARKAADRARAALRRAETNLGYTTIRSPVKGVIVDRRVNVGQTVVASLNAPSLFLIAKDLTRMQVWASVNEADIGQIRERGQAPKLAPSVLAALRAFPQPSTAAVNLTLAGIFHDSASTLRHLEYPGQQVRFTVDTYPDEVFTGEVAQVRLNATMTQNVVTYTVVVDTDNASGRLRPYLTANLQFLVDEREDVLMVPNGALRWRPTLHQVAPEYRDEFVRSLRRKATDKGGSKGSATLWVEDNGFVRPVKVVTGLSDGSKTEIVSGEVEEGMRVVIGSNSTAQAEATVNPFTPQFSNARKREPK
jgi:HlyD family secretion protein